MQKVRGEEMEHSYGDERGYLLEDYRFFHLRDERIFPVEYHYHTFDKIVLQIGGTVTYTVEGKRYDLKPGDILLVRHNLLHRPEIHPGEPYERIILWLGSEYLASRGGEWRLDSCFRLTEQRGLHLLRPRGEGRKRYGELFRRLEEAVASDAFAGGLMAETCLLQLLIHLNRDTMEGAAGEDVVYRFDAKMEEVTRYIGEHLSEDLPIQRLAQEFYLSRYYLMHRFKEVYGVTVHQYIRQKRLLHAAEEIRGGTPVLKAAVEAGFNDYSAFLRAFQSTYGKSPREWK